MRWRALAFVPLVLGPLAADPAAAVPEGRFVAEDDAGEVRIERREGKWIDVTIAHPALRATLKARLVRHSETGLWQERRRPEGWLARLRGSRPPPQPFAGERLVFAREDGDSLLATTFEVDDRGRPSLVRLAVRPAERGVRLEIRRFDGRSADARAPVSLERVEP
ncbi:MAG: hypothetical protein ACLFU0_07990 [Alphaproteobacteria bacterium]